MKLFFRELGSGQPLVILHGLFGASDNWMSIAKQLAENHKVYIVDQRNHGQSPKNEVFNYPVMAEDLNAFLEEHNISDPIIIGHSMGGKVAMQFAMNYPEKYQKLVVVDIAPKKYPVHHHQILEGLNSLPISTLKSRSEADKHLSQFVPELGVRQFLLKNLYRKDGGFDWRINLPVITKNIEISGHSLENQKPNHVPTLFLGGKKSHYIQPEDHQQIQEVFQNVEIVMLEDAGHWVHAEKPQLFLEHLVAFIQKE